MERRHFLTLALGLAAGAGLAVQAATQAQAAPVLPVRLLDDHEPTNHESSGAPQPAVAGQEDADRLTPEPVRYYRYRRRYFVRRRFYVRRYLVRRRYFRRRRYW